MHNAEWKRLLKKIAVLDRDRLEQLEKAIDEIIIAGKPSTTEKRTTKRPT